MMEYRRLIYENLILLVPLGEEAPSHGIICENEAMAHEYKLALGLGTHPDPDKSPSSYNPIPFEELPFPLYKIIQERDVTVDEPESNCCESGCPGCPWTLEQLRLSKKGS
jgi:hypothetical protein